MKSVVLALAFTCVSASADGPWLTIVGDPADPNADTIQINPIALSRTDARRVMQVRASRSHERTSTDGIRFRSYRAEVEFDCARLTARFLHSQFYAQPLWQVPGTEVHYPGDTPRPMEFRSFEPNPRDKVIRAACAG